MRFSRTLPEFGKKDYKYDYLSKLDVWWGQIHLRNWSSEVYITGKEMQQANWLLRWEWWDCSTLWWVSYHTKCKNYSHIQEPFEASQPRKCCQISVAWPNLKKRDENKTNWQFVTPDNCYSVIWLEPKSISPIFLSFGCWWRGKIVVFIHGNVV